MQFTSLLLATMALAMANAVEFTNSAFNGITAGQPITLTWSGASGPVTITLKNGPSTNLKTVSTITSGQTSGSFTWNVPATLAQDTYALEINDSTGTPNYSPQFELIGGASPSASSSASLSASSSASSASSALSSASSAISSAASSVSSSLSSQSAAASSSLSSMSSLIVSNTTSSAAPSTTGASNATTSSSSSTTATRSSTTGTRSSTTGTRSSSTTSPTSVPNANSAVQMASPLALVFLTFAAIFTLN